MNKKLYSLCKLLIGLAVVVFSSTSHAADWTLPYSPANVTQYGNTFIITPTGTDDTQNIQWAFDAANTAGPGGIIRLQRGQFYIGQVIAHGFDGSLTGSGVGNTFVDVVGPQSIPNYTPADFVPSAGEPQSPGSAGLLIFDGGGNIEVSDLTFNIMEPNPAVLHRSIHGLDLYTILDYIIYVTNRPPGNSISAEGVWIHDVVFKSLYNLPDLFWGINVRIGVAFEGANITPEVINVGETGTVTNTPFTGRHRLTNCVFDGQAIGLEGSGMAQGSLSVSESHFVNNNFGILFADSDNSMFDIFRNDIRISPENPNLVSYAAIAVWQFLGRPRTERVSGYLLPSAPPTVRISHNYLHTRGLLDAIAIIDLGFLWGYQQNGLTAEVSSNQILIDNTELGNVVWGGIAGVGPKSVEVLNNRISGTGIAGIYMGVVGDPAIGWTLRGNNVQQISAFVAPIWLGTGTSHTTVVGGSNLSNVLDEGTDNTITGVNNMRGNPPGPQIREAMQRKLANFHKW